MKNRMSINYQDGRFFVEDKLNKIWFLTDSQSKKPQKKTDRYVLYRYFKDRRVIYHLITYNFTVFKSYPNLGTFGNWISQIFFLRVHLHHKWFQCKQQDHLK